MRIILFVLALLIPFNVYAFCDDWRSSDTALLSLSLTITEIDREQTQWLLSQPRREGYYEKYNPFIPGHPSNTQIDTTFVLETLAALAATCALPHPLRDLFEGAWFGLELSDVRHNAADGIPTLFLGARF